MSLKYKVTSKDDIAPEDLKHYVERDGAWVLEVEGAVEKAKLEEFRTNNVALLKQLEEQKKRFEGIDPAEVRKLAEEKRRLEEQQQLKAGEFEKVLEARVKTVKADHDKALTALTGERGLADHIAVPQRAIHGHPWLDHAVGFREHLIEVPLQNRVTRQAQFEQDRGFATRR